MQINYNHPPIAIIRSHPFIIQMHIISPDPFLISSLIIENIMIAQRENTNCTNPFDLVVFLIINNQIH